MFCVVCFNVSGWVYMKLLHTICMFFLNYSLMKITNNLSLEIVTLLSGNGQPIQLFN